MTASQFENIDSEKSKKYPFKGPLSLGKLPLPALLSFLLCFRYLHSTWSDNSSFWNWKRTVFFVPSKRFHRCAGISLSYLNVISHQSCWWIKQGTESGELLYIRFMRNLKWTTFHFILVVLLWVLTFLVPQGSTRYSFVVSMVKKLYFPPPCLSHRRAKGCQPHKVVDSPLTLDLELAEDAASNEPISK